MPKKTSKNKNASRLGHDPLDDLNIDDDENLSTEKQKPSQNEHIPMKESAPKTETISLPSRFSIAEVDEIYTQMSSLLAQDTIDIELDGGNVESVDTSALQLLYAFNEKAAMSGKTIHWKSTSEKILESSRLLNINLSANSE